MTRARPWLALLLVTAFGILEDRALSRQRAWADFVPVAQEAGIDFEHTNGASPEKYLPETMGSGGLIFDYDGDGWSDVFLVDGGTFEGARGGARHRLYRNTTGESGTLGFDEVDGAAGIGAAGYGMGACAADYDNDGWTDLYVTAVGANTLYRNVEGRRFHDTSREAGVGAPLWSTSCAFADVDNDGDVDLYVANYVDFAVDDNKYCGDIRNVRFYCHPGIYDGVPDVLYRNNGDGTFTDISRDAGIYSEEGKGLGVVFSDIDGDGWVDIYVANDSVPNFLFHNRGGGRFEETALWAGVAVGLDGLPLAGMGTDAGDIDGDLRPDLIVTNLDRQTHSLYRNIGDGLFLDRTYESGVGEATLPYVGFGTAFFDYDNDGDLDLSIVNGDVLDNIALLKDNASYPQLNLLFENDGAGVFEEVGRSAGPGFGRVKVSRALVTGDLDNDGDLDLLVTNNGQRPDLLRNETGSGASLLVRVVGRDSNRDGIGARLTLSVDGTQIVREVRAGSSYLGQNDARVHFGMGSHSVASRLEIQWPSGHRDILTDVRAGQILTIGEGGEILSTRSMKNEQ